MVMGSHPMAMVKAEKGRSAVAEKRRSAVAERRVMSGRESDVLSIRGGREEVPIAAASERPPKAAAHEEVDIASEGRGEVLRRVGRE